MFTSPRSIISRASRSRTRCARRWRTGAARGITGTLLLAPEGINGTIAGPRAGIDAVLAHIRVAARLRRSGLEGKHRRTPPFARMKVRLKREIVTMGQPEVDPRARTGHYVDPADWNALIRPPTSR